jgi:LysM repeat protein
MSMSLRLLTLVVFLVVGLSQSGCQSRGSRTTSAPAHPSTVVEHRVQVGDTISSVASAYNVSIEVLIEANRLRDRHLRPGTILRIPGGRRPVVEPTTPVVVEKPVERPVEESWFIPRSAWTKQAVVLNRTTPMGGTPTRITIHHSGDKDDLHADTATWLRQVDLNHIKGLNHAEPWACIGYHFIIDASGKIYEGRPLKFQGAHAGNSEVNRLNIGICLMGDFDVQRVPAAQRTAMLSALDRLCLQYDISRAQVFGHKKFKVTQCPGRFLTQIIDAYAERTPTTEEPDRAQAALPAGATRLGAILPTKK